MILFRAEAGLIRINPRAFLLGAGVFFCFSSFCYSQGSIVDMKIPSKTVSNEDRFKNRNSARGSYIKVILIDQKTGKLINAIFPNSDFSNLYAKSTGFEYDEKNYRFKNWKAVEEFIDKNYVNFMRQHEEKSIDVNPGEGFFEKPSPLIFEKPMMFEELDVTNEREMLDKYFNFNYSTGSGYLKSEYYDQYLFNSAFIAMLIDLGYDAMGGDIAPILSISTTPFLYEGSIISKEKVLEIASEEARRLGYNVEDMKIQADEQNSLWEQDDLKVDPSIVVKIKGKTFFAICYTSKDKFVMGGVLWVLVDKHSGEVIISIPLK